MKEKFKTIKADENLFANMGFTDDEAKELQLRSCLMNIIIRYMKLEGLTQKEAAFRFHVTQSRVSNLVRGKIDLFSVSMLLTILEKAGFRIYKMIQESAENNFLYTSDQKFARCVHAVSAH